MGMPHKSMPAISSDHVELCQTNCNCNQLKI